MGRPTRDRNLSVGPWESALMLERVLMARDCRKRAAEWKERAETAMTAEEKRRDLIVAEHYSVLAEAAERSTRVTLEQRFPRMRTA
jgi:hypothetical protein